MATIITTNVIICYFHRDSLGLAAAFKDKSQTSFLLQFLKPLCPKDIECKPNWIEIICNRQISECEIVDINHRLQESISKNQHHGALRNCNIMLKFTFDLCRLLEGVEYIRDKLNKCKVSALQINNYLLEITQQIRNISTSKNIKNDLFILESPPKQILEENKKRIQNNDENKLKLTLKEIKYRDLMQKKQCKHLFYTVSESKNLLIPSDDIYPIDLYNKIEHKICEDVRYDYNTNMNTDVPIYPINPNHNKYGISLKDFIDRKFHLNNNIVRKWLMDRAYLMDNKNNEDKEEVTYRKFAIIDVRCDDFAGGNIPYCYNVAFDGFELMLNDLLKEFEHESDVIFHCMYSQHRAPRSAYCYWRERRKWEHKYKSKLCTQRVWVLDGGFKQWISDYILHSHLVCNFDTSYWDEEYFPLTGREFFYKNDWKP